MPLVLFAENFLATLPRMQSPVARTPTPSKHKRTKNESESGVVKGNKGEKEEVTPKRKKGSKAYLKEQKEQEEEEELVAPTQRDEEEEEAKVEEKEKIEEGNILLFLKLYLGLYIILLP